MNWYIGIYVLSMTVVERTVCWLDTRVVVVRDVSVLSFFNFFLYTIFKISIQLEKFSQIISTVLSIHLIRDDLHIISDI